MQHFYLQGKIYSHCTVKFIWHMSKIRRSSHRIKTELCPPSLKQSSSVAKCNPQFIRSKLDARALPAHDRHKTQNIEQRSRFQQPHRILLIANRSHKAISSNSQTLNKINNHQQIDTPPKYDLENVVGKGGFGVVYRAKCFSNGQTLAIKKVVRDKRFKNRELAILRQLKHPNIIRLQDHYYNVEHDREYLFLAMDYYPRDLASLLKKKALIKDMLPVYLLQILRGLQYLSENRVAHRDIKPHNILIDIASHNAVICDFGSAKQLTQGESNISYICARGYRAPELIFGSIFYSTAVDMWSFGCIVMEMINYIPLFRGRSNIEQMISIMEVLGRPTETQMAEMNPSFSRKEFESMPRVKGKSWKDVLLTSNQLLIDLVSRIMVYSPDQRYSPTQSISHPFFDCLRNSNHIAYLENKYGPLPFLSEIETKPQQITTPTLKRANENLRTMSTISEFESAQNTNRRSDDTGHNLSNLKVDLRHHKLF